MEDIPKWFNPDRLIKLLTQQRELYRRLRLLSERQRNLIAGDHPERLLNILGDRQNLVTELARINEQLSPFRRDWAGIYSKLPQDVRRQAAALLDEINAALQAILKSDDEDTRLLAAKKQTVAQSLGNVSGGQTANQAYARQGGGAAPDSASDRLA